MSDPNEDITAPQVPVALVDEVAKLRQEVSQKDALLKKLSDQIDGALWVEDSKSGRAKVVKWGRHFWRDFFISAWQTATRAHKARLAGGGLTFLSLWSAGSVYLHAHWRDILHFALSFTGNE